MLFLIDLIYYFCIIAYKKVIFMKKERKTLYKISNDYQRLLNRNYKLFGSLTASLIGMNIMQNIFDLSDTKETRIMKFGVLGIMAEELLRNFGKYYMQRVKYAKLLEFLIYLDTNGYEKDDIYKMDEDELKKYYNELSDLLYGVNISNYKTEESIFFTLHLNDETSINEVISNDGYKCYFIDKDLNEIDITKKAKTFLKRTK